MKYCEPDLCVATANALLELVKKESLSGSTKTWEMRHAGLIGLKYWMAVRSDLLERVLVDEAHKETEIFKAIIAGLG